MKIPTKQSPATKRPDRYGNGKLYEGHDLTLAEMRAIYSVGRTPRQAIEAFARARRVGKVTKVEPMTGGDPRYTWGARWLADGTSMKAAIHVPGGVIMTWWK